MFVPRQPISAPAVAEPLGLATAVGLAVLDTSQGDPEDPRSDWTKGYELVGEVCGIHELYIGSTQVCDDSGNLIDNVPDRGRLERGRSGVFSGLEASVPGAPFHLGAGVECSVRGAIDLDEWRARAARRLDLCRWSGLANELWTGEMSRDEGLGNRFLMHHDATLVRTGTPLSVINGVAAMDDALRTCSCGGPRVIHVPTYLIDHMAAKAVIVRVGQRWYTPAGSVVVSDDGYPGTGPMTDATTERAAPTANQSWIYGTQPIVVKWDTVRYPGAEGAGGGLAGVIAYETNDIVVTAEQFAMASWLCCHFAALIDTSITP